MAIHLWLCYTNNIAETAILSSSFIFGCFLVWISKQQQQQEESQKE